MKLDYDTVKSILEAAQHSMELFYSLVGNLSPKTLEDFKADTYEEIIVTLTALSGDDWPEVRTMLDKAALELNFWD